MPQDTSAIHLPYFGMPHSPRSQPHKWIFPLNTIFKLTSLINFECVESRVRRPKHNTMKMTWREAWNSFHPNKLICLKNKSWSLLLLIRRELSARLLNNWIIWIRLTVGRLTKLNFIWGKPWHVWALATFVCLLSANVRNARICIFIKNDYELDNEISKSRKASEERAFEYRIRINEIYSHTFVRDQASGIPSRLMEQQLLTCSSIFGYFSLCEFISLQSHNSYKYIYLMALRRTRLRWCKEVVRVRCRYRNFHNAAENPEKRTPQNDGTRNLQPDQRGGAKTFDENVNEPTVEDKRRTLGRWYSTFWEKRPRMSYPSISKHTHTHTFTCAQLH